MLYKRLSPVITSTALLFVPLIVSAQTPIASAGANVCSTGVSDFASFVQYLVECLIGGLINRLIIAAAIAVFFIGVVRFIYKAGQGDTDYQKNIAKYLGWSILALFVMLSVWGLVFMLGATFGIGQGGVAPVPTLPTSR